MENMHLLRMKQNNWKFYCHTCDYGCKRRFLLQQHEKTKKHEMLKNAQKCSKSNSSTNSKEIKNKKKESLYYLCKCNRQYKHIQSYRRHQKNCDFYKNNNLISIKDDSLHLNEDYKNIILENTVMKEVIDQYKNLVDDKNNENKEMRELFSQLLPKIGNNNTTINNTLNLQVFLNEKCKDALNLTDFINTLELGNVDLEITKEFGLAEVIANVFVRGLNALAQDKRPIHCSDLKKEVLYVKDDGVWEKENNERLKIKGAISSFSKKQIKSIKKWEENNPNWENTEEGTKNYFHMVQLLTDPVNEEQENKIIKGIAKEVIIKN